MDWFKEHGSKLLALLATVLAGGNGLDPSLVTGLISDSGKRWGAFLLGAATLAHATFVAPQGATDASARRARSADPADSQP